MSYVSMGRDTQNTRNNLTRYCYRCPAHRTKKITLRKGSFWEHCSKAGSYDLLLLIESACYHVMTRVSREIRGCAKRPF